MQDTNDELKRAMNIINEEKEYLQQENLGLRKHVCATRKTNSKLKKASESEMQVEQQRHDKERDVLISQIKDLQEQLQVVMDMIRKQYEFEMKTNADYLKYYIEENQELRRELAALKARGSAYNLQMIDDSSEMQHEQAEKVSLASFHPIKVLGEGDFGKVLLAEKKSPNGARELFALKMLKKFLPY